MSHTIYDTNIKPSLLIAAFNLRARNALIERLLGDNHLDMVPHRSRAKTRRPGMRGKGLIHLNEVARRYPAPVHAEKIACFPQDSWSREDAGEIAGQRLVGQISDDIARVVAKDRHAFAIGIVRSD